MHRPPGEREKGSRFSYSVTLLLTLLLILSLWQTARLSGENALVALEQQGRYQLGLYVAHLRGQLEKYESIPELLATNERLIALLQQPGDSRTTEEVSRYLATLNSISGAADTYLMDRDGLTIAASNWQSELPFVGRNFSYRPYFEEAMQGRLGRYFALGSTSKRRGYYFAFPLLAREEILGAIVIKIDIEQIETSWNSSADRFVVTDEDGVIFITTEGDWHFRALEPLTPERRRQIMESRRYVNTPIEPLAIAASSELPSGVRKIRFSADDEEGFLMLEQGMPEAGWKVYTLAPLHPVTQQVNRSLTLVAGLYILLLLLVLFWNQRRRRLLERARFEREAKHDLEIRVRERTRELTEANSRLTLEIEQHEQTEQELYQTQDQLIQSAKMAVLGQMATGISHELNQPLSAIRSYADNSRALLQRERKEEACWNLRQISELTERMATISSQLKVFARKTSGRLVTVSLPAAIGYSLKILGPRIKEVAAEVRLELPEEEVFLHADMVQLEQVFVNLISNALHAVEGRERRLIEISGSQRDSRFAVAIRDSGSGIEAAHLKRIFDPFFTTRKESSGLGLGLSISHRIVEGMGGTLEAINHPQGGAVFVLEMQMISEPVNG